MPPTITVEGRDLGSEEEEQWSRASSKSRIYTPGNPLTPNQVLVVVVVRMVEILVVVVVMVVVVDGGDCGGGGNQSRGLV